MGSGGESEHVEQLPLLLWVHFEIFPPFGTVPPRLSESECS